MMLGLLLRWEVASVLVEHCCGTSWGYTQTLEEIAINLEKSQKHSLAELAYTDSK